MKPINLFVGYDEREACGFHVFASSVIRRASRPVRITPLASMGLPRGSNSFTLSRFLVPALAGFKGNAIFMDGSDMMCLGDIAELADLADPNFAVQVVRHKDYDSRHARKYIGTEMECAQTNYSRKNWASVMTFNCAHSAWFGLTPQAIEMKSPMQLLQFQDLIDKEIGELPPEWNVLVDEGQDDTNAKIVHFTAGTPMFSHYKNARRSKDWFNEFNKMTQGMQEG